MRLSAAKSGRAIELGDHVVVEIDNVSVLRRRIDFTLVQAAEHADRPKLESSPRAGVRQKKKAGREVDRVQRDQHERGGKPRKGGGGKLRIGVSHRGGPRDKKRR